MKVGKEETKISVLSGVKVIRQRVLLDIDIIGWPKLQLKPGSSLPVKPSLTIVPFVQSSRATLCPAWS